MLRWLRNLILAAAAVGAVGAMPMDTSVAKGDDDWRWGRRGWRDDGWRWRDGRRWRGDWGRRYGGGYYGPYYHGGYYRPYYRPYYYSPYYYPPYGYYYGGYSVATPYFGVYVW